MTTPDNCWTCGRKRGLSQLRRSWSLGCPTAIVPRTDNAEDRPAQISNDLVYNAAVWRNGGTNDETQLCDDCLRIGLRALKLEVSSLLQELDDGHDKDAELATLTQRLGLLQLRHNNLAYAHNRMQDRLKQVLDALQAHGIEATGVVLDAQWEVDRGHAEEGNC